MKPEGLGLNMNVIKKHPALIPLFACLGFGVFISTGYTLRLALRNPDVSWAPNKNPEPWNAYKDKEYKFYSPRSAGAKSQAPEY